MGLFDKAKKATNQAIGAAKNIDKEFNKQAQKRNEQKEIKKQEKERIKDVKILSKG